jgi:hypothetical protein
MKVSEPALGDAQSSPKRRFFPSSEFPFTSQFEYRFEPAGYLRGHPARESAKPVAIRKWDFDDGEGVTAISNSGQLRLEVR